MNGEIGLTFELKHQLCQHSQATPNPEIDVLCIYRPTKLRVCHVDGPKMMAITTTTTTKKNIYPDY